MFIKQPKYYHSSAIQYSQALHVYKLENSLRKSVIQMPKTFENVHNYCTRIRQDYWLPSAASYHYALNAHY